MAGDFADHFVEVRTVLDLRRHPPEEGCAGFFRRENGRERREPIAAFSVPLRCGGLNGPAIRRAPDDAIG